jgi:hypothetical protein
MIVQQHTSAFQLDQLARIVSNPDETKKTWVGDVSSTNFPHEEKTTYDPVERLWKSRSVRNTMVSLSGRNLRFVTLCSMHDNLAKRTETNFP